MNYAKQYQARLRRFVLAVMLILAACSITLSAQTFSEIYQFTDLYSYTSLTNTLAIDAAGRLYGTIPYGQPQTCAWDGEVFQLRQAGTGWILNPLYCFQGGDDGYEPYDYGGLKVRLGRRPVWHYGWWWYERGLQWRLRHRLSARTATQPVPHCDLLLEINYRLRLRSRWEFRNSHRWRYL